MREEYKKFIIEFCEHPEEFVLKLEGDEIYRNHDLNKVREYADKFLKKKFKRIPVFMSSYGDEIIKKTVTSITERGAFWTITNKGSRSKEYKSDTAYKYNSKNIELVKKHAAISKQIEELKKNQAAIIQKMDYYSEEELQKAVSGEPNGP